MTPERWVQVKELYHSVVDRDPDARRSVLQALRETDPGLCDEVESLLGESGETWTLGPNLFQNLELLEKHVGQLVGGRYRVARRIGRGGFGVVYLARDERLHDKPVVVKFLIGAVRRDDWADQKFAGEVKALARIDHPGVVGILDQGRTAEGVPFLVMQYVEGVPLRALIGPQGMTGRRAAELVRQIGQALAAAHERGILHRDLKPENIMVQTTTSGEFVRLIDFGIATIREEGPGRTAGHTRVVGTADYMAPEQFRGEPVPASDVFAMAVIAWELLTGSLPAGGALEPPPGMPPAPVAVIRRALSLDPAQRFPGAAAFGDALAAALAEIPAAPATPLEQVQQRALDVAAARQIPIHKAAEVVALIRRGESGGLTAILEVDRDFSVTREDVRTKPFPLEFPLDSTGRPAPLQLGLRVECPDFEPKAAFKTILVPPDRDSDACTFLITPRYLGELRINLEVVRGDLLVASRTLKTESLPSDRVLDASTTVVSIDLPVMVRAAPIVVDAVARVQAVHLAKTLQQSRFEQAQAVLGSAPPPPAAPGEFTRMFGSPGTPPAPQGPGEFTRMIARSRPVIPATPPPVVVPRQPPSPQPPVPAPAPPAPPRTAKRAAVLTLLLLLALIVLWLALRR